MKSSWQIVCVISTLILSSQGWTQTLTEKLAAEDPARLITQSRAEGDIVRGAILFHQGNINCAQCHRPSAAAERIGPDLSKIAADVSDEHLVESVLYPSRVIKEGFETTTVLTDDGQTITGLLVRRDNDQLVLRDSQDPDRLIAIPVTGIEETRPGKKSSMPDGLANELKNRQQFLDLLRYVMDLRERGPGVGVAVSRQHQSRDLGPELEGRVLIQKLNCGACHDLGEGLGGAGGKQAPSLRWSGRHLNPEHLARFIAAPHDVKPGTSMPGLLGHLDQEERLERARAMAHYLAREAGNDYQHEAIDPESIPRGYRLFHEVGCVACHSPRTEAGIEKGLVDSIPLGPLEKKYNLGALVQFLEQPLMVRPSGHMPDMSLTHREAIDIAGFLLQSSEPNPPAWKLDLDQARTGEVFFQQHHCGQCHTDVATADSAQSPRTQLDRLDSDRGCLSGNAGDWPAFQFDALDQQRIRAALRSSTGSLTKEQQIRVSLKAMNCIACHDRGDFGGVSVDRNPHFQTTNLNLGDQGRIPPTLTGVGAKLKAKWMRDVLVNGQAIRPYMKTRMPQYGEVNVGHLVPLFQDADQLGPTEFATFKDPQPMRKQGLALAGNQGLNCVACHTYKYMRSDTMPAVDLTEMADRLNKDWFYQYMLAPQRFSPNTVMPSFWPGGVAIRPDIEGSPELQIEALWQYLIDGRQAATPRGVVRERLEIAVSAEARMLRRQYPGIGKRGIGVGYPGGINLAYDAEQMRLGSIWQGKFADPGGVWTGQGSGNVRPLGRTIEFPKGPELDFIANPWKVDDGRPPLHQFKGYSLDRARRPAFRYSFDSVDIKDSFQEVVEEDLVFFRRTVTITSGKSRDDLRFRIISGKEFGNGRGQFTVDRTLMVRLGSEHSLQVEDDQLVVPLKLEAGENEPLVIEYLWE